MRKKQRSLASLLPLLTGLGKALPSLPSMGTPMPSPKKRGNSPTTPPSYRRWGDGNRTLNFKEHKKRRRMQKEGRKAARKG